MQEDFFFFFLMLWIRCFVFINEQLFINCVFCMLNFTMDVAISTPSITSVSPLSMEYSFTSCHLVCVDESFSAVELDCGIWLL